MVTVNAESESVSESILEEALTAKNLIKGTASFRALTDRAERSPSMAMLLFNGVHEIGAMNTRHDHGQNDDHEYD